MLQVHKMTNVYSTLRGAHNNIKVDDRPSVRPKDTWALGVTRLRAPALLPQTSDTQQVEVVLRAEC